MEKEWILSTNIYEVNLRQYTKEGTINAFASALPRLKDMGVETLWFMPVTPISAKNRKGSMGSYYACSDYTAVAEEFGTLEDFRHLVTEAHKMGFRIILDWVANHTGWDHRWTRDHPDFYKKDESGNFVIASGMDDIIELDFHNKEMRRAMIDAMAFWVNETGIDGFRCDLAFWVQLDFWKEAMNDLENIKALFWLGELDPLDNPEYMQVFDAAYTWTWMHKTRDFFHGEKKFSDLIDVLDRYSKQGGLKTWFTTNHDENSWNGTEYEKYGEAALCMAVFSCTWPGIPLIYSGQELPNKKRLSFFEKDVIDWNNNMMLHSFYKKLLHLHAEHPALSADEKNSPATIFDTGNKPVLAFMREKDGKEVIVILNFSGQMQSMRLPLSGKYNHLFGDVHADFSGHATFSLEPWHYHVLVK